MAKMHILIIFVALLGVVSVVPATVSATEWAGYDRALNHLFIRLDEVDRVEVGQLTGGDGPLPTLSCPLSRTRLEMAVPSDILATKGEVDRGILVLQAVSEDGSASWTAYCHVYELRGRMDCGVRFFHDGGWVYKGPRDTHPRRETCASFPSQFHLFRR